jgi:outer membrane lipoprotein SlyB
MTDAPRRSVLPASVWLVLGCAIGAAIGNGGGGHTAGLVLGSLIGAAAGYGVASALERRR